MTVVETEVNEGECVRGGARRSIELPSGDTDHGASAEDLRYGLLHAPNPTKRLRAPSPRRGRNRGTKDGHWLRIARFDASRQRGCDAHADAASAIPANVKCAPRRPATL